MPPTFAKTKCALNLNSAASGIIDQGKLNELYDAIDRRKQEGSVAEVSAQEGKKLADKAAYDAFRTKQTAIGNAIAKRKISQTIGGWTKKGMKPSKAFEAYTLGTSTDPGVGTRYNAASVRRTLIDKENAIALNQLRKEKIDKVVTDGKLDAHLGEAMAKLSSPEIETPNLDQLQATDRQAVERAAQILKEQQNRLRQMAATKGAFIAERPGFIAPQTHERAKIRTASRSRNAMSLMLHGDRPIEADRMAYLRDLHDTMDAEATRQNLVRQGRLSEKESLDPQKFSQSLWEIFTTGVRKEGGQVSGFPGNVAAQAEKGRLIEFKDPASWVAYNQKYGSGGIWQAHLNQIKQMAHTIATLDFFGPSAEKNFESAIEQTKLDLREKLNQATVGSSEGASAGTEGEPIPSADPALAEKIQGQLDDLSHSKAQNYFDTYSGVYEEPGNMTLDRIVNGVMSWQRMAHLGGALFTNFEAATTSFLQMHYAGVPLLRAAFRPLFSGLERLPKAELNDFVRRMGAGSMGMFSQAAQHVAGTSAEPGAIMKNFENIFFKGTGLSQFMDMIRNNYVFALNNEMAHNAGKEFADLPAKMQRHLGDYNISPAEWEVMREHALTNIQGYDMLAPDQIRNAPDEAFHGIAGSDTPFAVKNARLDAETKLNNLFIDSADYASVMHDLKTHAMIGQYAGHGIIGRMALQFQTFPVAHGQKVISRAWASQSFPEFFFKTVGALVLTGMLTGEAKNLLDGRNMLANPDLWQDDDKGKAAAAWGKMVAFGAARSGAAAFLGDALFSQNYLSGHNPDSAIPGLLGPTGETFTHAASMVYKAAFQGKVDGPDVARFVQGNTPFINTWWVKPLINYGLMYGLQEQLAPGTLNRIEEKANQNGAPFWLPPSEYARQ